MSFEYQFMNIKYFSNKKYTLCTKGEFSIFKKKLLVSRDNVYETYLLGISFEQVTSFQTCFMSTTYEQGIVTCLLGMEELFIENRLDGKSSSG